MPELDFQRVAAAILSRAREVVPQWLPGGRFEGHEWVCANIQGGKGDSFRVSINSGKWADFATENHRGGDLIALYAAIKGLKQFESAQALIREYGLDPGQAPPSAALAKKDMTVGKPPANAAPPDMIHPRHGSPSGSWRYTDEDGNTLFYVARYNTETGKEIAPWSWVTQTQSYRQKGYPEPRPIYGLPLLKSRPDAPVMVVEGEKSAEAARAFCEKVYNVVTWSHGTNSVGKTDWTTLHGKKILIWPDADSPGLKAALDIASFLFKHVTEIKLIDVRGLPKKWDAADALAEGFTWDKFYSWAKPRVIKYDPNNLPTPEIVPEVLPPETKAPAPDLNVSVSVSEDEGVMSESAAALAERLGLQLTGKGFPLMTFSNCRRVLRRHDAFKGSVWYDTFHRKIFTSLNRPDGEASAWTDDDTFELLYTFQREMGFTKLSDDILYKAVQSVASKDLRSEPRDWMAGLKWDGVERVQGFLYECMGIPASEYTYSVSKNFWVSMVARVFKPGCKADHMMILEGPQGSLKSTALNAIGGRWYSEMAVSIESQEFLSNMHGKLLLEVGELSSLSKAEAATIKRVLTTQVDYFRLKYARLPQEFPRQSILVGTTNESEYLTDPTGGRRFWPVRIQTIDLQRIKDNREQLFAEAVHMFKNGAIWHGTPEKETKEVQEMRRIMDAWEPLINDFIRKDGYKKNHFTFQEVAEILKIEPARQDRQCMIRIGRILTGLGYVRHRYWDAVECCTKMLYVSPEFFTEATQPVGAVQESP